PQAATTPGELAPVQAGQTLSEIAAPLAAEAGITVNQAMVLLLRTNPEAFIGGNLNLVRQGAVLRVPARDQWTECSAAEANALVREQVGQWREMRRPAPQPDAIGADAVAAGAPAAAAAAAPGAGAQARLEITPPSGDAQRAGMQSGIDAGGGGDMLRPELQQADESIGARTAEVEELKARLADLEQLQAQQQQLIALKDAELAAAQQRMETSNQEQAASAASIPWLWLGVGLLIVAALAFVLGRRARTPAALPARRLDSAALAAGMPGGAWSPASAPAFVATPATSPTPVEPPVPATARPTWHAGQGSLPPASPAPVAVEPELAPAPVVVDRNAPAVAGPSSAAVDPVELPVGVERLELARAYLDLGDTDTARTLLQEVLHGDDPGAATDAARLLRTLD
ncbi:ferrous iron transporter B, partial [Lysobacteraceae bacterium NML93-0793]